MDTVYFAQMNQVMVLRFVGFIRYPLSPALEQLLNRILTDSSPTIQAIVIDLCQTQLIDSTNLGLLARIANWSITHLQVKPVLYSTNPDVTSTLLGVSFDLVFTILNQQPTDQITPPPNTVLTPTDMPADLGPMILRAHETLMALSDNNYQQFAEVVRVLQAQQPTPKD